MTRHGGLQLLCCLSLMLAGVAARTATVGQELAQETGKVLIGTPAPPLVLHTIDGDRIDLGALYGKKAVYLKFWATWCTPCREQMPHFQKAYESAGADLAVIAIDVGFNDSIAAVRALRQKIGITMPIVFDDGQAGGAFHLRVTPQHIVIGRDGRILYVGHLADAQLDAALLAARGARRLDSPVVAGTRGGSPAAGMPVATHYGVGQQLPAQSLTLVSGERVAFRDTANTRKTVLVFLSPWCESYLATTRPVVSANCRRMREQVSELAGDRHARWIGIASGLWATAEDLGEYRTKYQVTLPLTLDASGAWFRAFDVTEVPQAIVADSNGRILRRIRGSDLSDPAAMRSAVGDQ